MGYTNKEFNSSGSVEVGVIRMQAEQLAEIIMTYCPEGPLRDKALTDTHSASKFAVKSLFQ